MSLVMMASDTIRLSFATPYAIDAAARPAPPFRRRISRLSRLGRSFLAGFRRASGLPISRRHGCRHDFLARRADFACVRGRRQRRARVPIFGARCCRLQRPRHLGAGSRFLGAARAFHRAFTIRRKEAKMLISRNADVMPRAGI